MASSPSHAIAGAPTSTSVAASLTAAAAAQAAPASALAYDAWSKHVHSGQPMMIRELNDTAIAEQLPPAVRVRAQLDWFDGSASIEQCIMQQAASAAAAATAESANASEAMEDTAEAVAAAADAVSFSSSAPAVASSGSGVLQLRSGAHTLLVDSSLLHSASQWSTTARAVGADGETSSQISMLQFEPGGWYEVIGEVMRSTPNGVASEVAGAPTVFVRARVCRALDDSFDAQLFEETVLLRRKMLAER